MMIEFSLYPDPHKSNNCKEIVYEWEGIIQNDREHLSLPSLSVDIFHIASMIQQNF